MLLAGAVLAVCVSIGSRSFVKRKGTGLLVAELEFVALGRFATGWGYHDASVVEEDVEAGLFG